MDKIVSEIIIGAIILTLLISVVPIYRSSAELVGSVGEKMDVNENIKGGDDWTVACRRRCLLGTISVGADRVFCDEISLFRYQ